MSFVYIIYQKLPIYVKDYYEKPVSISVHPSLFFNT